MLDRLMSKEFWNRALARMLRTVCQVFIGATASCQLIGQVDWMLILSTSCLSALTSLVTSILLVLPEEDAEKEQIQG